MQLKGAIQQGHSEKVTGKCHGLCQGLQERIHPMCGQCFFTDTWHYCKLFVRTGKKYQMIVLELHFVIDRRDCEHEPFTCSRLNLYNNTSMAHLWYMSNEGHTRLSDIVADPCRPYYANLLYWPLYFR